MNTKQYMGRFWGWGGKKRKKILKNASSCKMGTKCTWMNPRRYKMDNITLKKNVLLLHSFLFLSSIKSVEKKCVTLSVFKRLIQIRANVKFLISLVDLLFEG